MLDMGGNAWWYARTERGWVYVDPAYLALVTARHAAALAPVEKSCQALRDAAANLGRPAETQAWRQKLRELLTALP